jgi:hypothetical protein
VSLVATFLSVTPDLPTFVGWIQQHVSDTIETEQTVVVPSLSVHQ